MAKNRKNRKNQSANIPEKAMVASNPNKVTNSLLSKLGIGVSDDLLDNLPEDKKQELKALTEKLEQLIQVNTDEGKVLEEKRNFLEIEKEVIENDKNQVKTEKLLLESNIKDWKEKQQVLSAKQNDLVKLEEELEIKKANANAGFAQERHNSLSSLKKQYESLEKQQSEVQEQQSQQHIILMNQERKLIAEIQKKEELHFKDIRQDLEKAEEELTQKKLHLDVLKKKLENKLVEQEKEAKKLKDETIVKYTSKNIELTHEIDLLSKHRERDEETIQQLRERLSGYRELEREAKLKELGGPTDVLQFLDRLENDLKDARKKLRGRSESDLEEELDHYRELSEELEEKLQDLKQEYDDLRLRENRNKLSVREKMELQKQNDVLEISNQALTHSIGTLRSEIDDLIEKQQSKDAFPQLLKMDRELLQKRPAQHVDELSGFVEDLQYRLACAEGTVLYYDLDVVRMFVAGLAMSQLHVFQGISGTGKTSLVKAFAKAVGGHVTTVPVQAGWRDRDDLVGHYNAFEKRYYEKECLQGLYKAQTNACKNRFNIILLDEMNLSRPEQYFAEFLSALEMRKGQQEIVLMDSAVSNAPKEFIEGRKVSLSDNLWFMGTANHDETTFEFADKTHDRAFIMDLQRQRIPSGWKPKAVDIDPIDFGSVIALFDKAEKKNTSLVDGMLDKLKKSEFSTQLESDFSIGWGNRFEKQAKRFIAVYAACGGEPAQALEHLLISRILRKGKVLGRYDISQKKIDQLYKNLECLFKDLGGDAMYAGEALLQESVKKAEGVY